MSEFKTVWVIQEIFTNEIRGCTTEEKQILPANYKRTNYVEYAALEAKDKRIAELELALFDRSEKYKLFIDKGLWEKCEQVKDLQSKLDTYEKIVSFYKQHADCNRDNVGLGICKCSFCKNVDVFRDMHRSIRKPQGGEQLLNAMVDLVLRNPQGGANG